MDTPVHVEQQGGVQVITLNRPEVRNAINTATAVAIAKALDQLDDRSDLVAGVITGAGGTFCTGMDLKAFLAGERPSVEGRGFAGITEKSSEKPLIAAVEGYAVAGGFEIVLACDLIVASETAVFGLPEVKRGLLAGGGGLLRLPRRVPHQLAVEWSLTGDYFSAAVAHDARLLNRLVPEGQALDEALALATS
uniref:crotonase/enoyl-CoA hydratase family protein n=1 Tax=Rhodococcus marinonascens TaxID=38311 RepID=UPI000933755D